MMKRPRALGERGAGLADGLKTVAPDTGSLPRGGTPGEAQSERVKRGSRHDDQGVASSTRRSGDSHSTRSAKTTARLEGMEAVKDTRVNPGRILAWLVLGGLGVFLAVIIFGAMIPSQTDAEKQALLEQQIAGACDLKWTKTEERAAECRAREYLERAPKALH